MQLNYNLLNLLTQLIQAIMISGSKEPVYDITDPEVVRLREAFYDAYIKDVLSEDPKDEGLRHTAEIKLLGLIHTFTI